MLNSPQLVYWSAHIFLIQTLLDAREEIRDIFSLFFWENWSHHNFLLKFSDLYHVLQGRF